MVGRNNSRKSTTPLTTVCWRMHAAASTAACCEGFSFLWDMYMLVCYYMADFGICQGAFKMRSERYNDIINFNVERF